MFRPRKLQINFLIDYLRGHKPLRNLRKNNLVDLTSSRMRVSEYPPEHRKKPAPDETRKFHYAKPNSTIYHRQRSQKFEEAQSLGFNHIISLIESQAMKVLNVTPHLELIINSLMYRCTNSELSNLRYNIGRKKDSLYSFTNYSPFAD